jgi:hypothetical protein
VRGLVLSFNKLLKNKNAVTFLCVFAGVIVLWVGYNYRFNSAVNPVEVPYAITEIKPRTKIEDSMIGIVKIPGSMLTSGIVTTKESVIGKYVNYNTIIPAGSLFYKNVLVDWSDMPDSAWADIKDGYTVIALPVSVESTLGNSIRPGNVIDLYYAATESDGRLLLGKLIESIEVLAVKDSTGKNVFDDASNPGTPAYLVFAVSEELHLLLRKATYLSGDIIPVQRNANYTNSLKPPTVSSEYIRDFILSQTVNLDSEELTGLETE